MSKLKYVRVIVLVSLVVVLATSVSACGRKNDPVPPEGSNYPQDYPTE